MLVVLVGLIILGSNFVYFLNLGTYYRFESKISHKALRNQELVRFSCNLNYHFRYYLDGSGNNSIEIQAKNQHEAQKYLNELAICIDKSEYDYIFLKIQKHKQV